METEYKWSISKMTAMPLVPTVSLVVESDDSSDSPEAKKVLYGSSSRFIQRFSLVPNAMCDCNSGRLSDKILQLGVNDPFIIPGMTHVHHRPLSQILQWHKFFPFAS
jgi:isopentenyl diphosphate isomerase/L-lactate dehydrogenase-like FMN-dependent dehydrogenase